MGAITEMVVVAGKERETRHGCPLFVLEREGYWSTPLFHLVATMALSHDH